MRKVCVVTGTRAEYGLLSGLIARLRAAQDIDLILAITGAHLSVEHGATYREILSDGHTIDAQVEILDGSDSRLDVARATARALSGFAEVFEEQRPDLVVLLGDRYEILAVAAAALLMGVPVAHLHGGETTEGAMDESLRHAITKMSSLHFVAAEPYRRRVIQLGEDPDHVFLVGGLGVDVITQTTLLSHAELCSDLGVDPAGAILVTFHPETAESDSAQTQVSPLLTALAQFTDRTIIFTMPNADPAGLAMRELIEKFVQTHDNAHAYDSLGYLRYLSCLAQVAAVVGNSSSGLAEAPTFGVPTVNIGSRQDGRLRATSVIDATNQADEIVAAIRQATSSEFRNVARSTVNPYGRGGAADAIVDVVRRIPLEGLARKRFHDLPV